LLAKKKSCIGSATALVFAVLIIHRTENRGQTEAKLNFLFSSCFLTCIFLTNFIIIHNMILALVKVYGSETFYPEEYELLTDPANIVIFSHITLLLLLNFKTTVTISAQILALLRISHSRRRILFCSSPPNSIQVVSGILTHHGVLQLHPCSIMHLLFCLLPIYHDPHILVNACLFICNFNNSDQSPNFQTCIQKIVFNFALLDNCHNFSEYFTCLAFGSSVLSPDSN